MKHVAFFGDGEKMFALTPELIQELEQKTGTGIGALCQRTFRSDFRFSDLTETILLGLIGGGTTPADAARLTTLYAEQRPIAETLAVALPILEAVFFGAPAEDAPKVDDEQPDQDNEQEAPADE